MKEENSAISNSARSGEPQKAGPELTRREPHERLADVLAQFIREIDSLASTFPLTSDTIRSANRKAAGEIARFLQEHATPVMRPDSAGSDDTGAVRFEIHEGQESKFESLNRIFSRTAMAAVLVPTSLFVALISQYDSYLGMLIKTLLLFRPEILNGSEKTLRFSDIVEFDSIEAARDHIIEKEIGAILRESHAEHFDWMESKFDLKLRKDLPVWPEFIEITERRNLFVHTGGVVSAQYLKVCGGPTTTHLGVEKGKRLAVELAYFERAYEVLFEIGVKLAHVLWRKLMPNKLKEADQNLLKISFDLIVEGKYSLAIILLDFATTILKKQSSADYRLRFVVNRAQAYKWSGNVSRALEILNAEDFSAAKAVFRLAEAVLRDDFERALLAVREIGSSGEIGIVEYREWPLFKEFRKDDKFANIIFEIFNLPLHEVSLKTATGELSPGSDESTKVNSSAASENDSQNAASAKDTLIM